MANRLWKFYEPKFQADKVCEMNPVWPWGGHRRFAYDLVRWMRPTRVVELGVHWGTSFFTFAQAIKDGRLRDTELIGVDTFEGEEHAGEYGPEVLDTVRKIVAKSFPKQRIFLHQMYFADALHLVEDESADIIHIDGLHTYEAVKEDFETWAPKLAPNGVVLFHDVAPDTEYGSTQYWNEISAEHPAFAFAHSWGLGVLFPKGRDRLDEISGIEDKLIAYPALARADRASHEIRDLSTMAESRLRTIEEQSKTDAELRERIKRVSEDLTQRAEAAEAMAVDRLQVMQEQSEKIRHRDDQLSRERRKLHDAQALAEERHQAIQHLSERVGRAERAAAGMKADASKLEALNEQLAQQAKETVRQIEGQQEAIDRRDREAETTRARLDELASEHAGLRESLARRETELDQAKVLLANSDRASRELSETLAQLSQHVAALASSHARERDAGEQRAKSLMAKIESMERRADAAAGDLRKRMQTLETDAELQSVRAEHLEAVAATQREQIKRLAAQGAVEEDWLTGA